MQDLTVQHGRATHLHLPFVGSLLLLLLLKLLLLKLLLLELLLLLRLRLLLLQLLHLPPLPLKIQGA